MKRNLDFVTTALILVSMFCFSTAALAGVKKIAVLDFEDTSVSSNTPDFDDNPMAAFAMMTGRGQVQQQDNGKIGKSVSNILVTELVNDGTFKVVERSQLDEIMAEQKLGKDGTLSANEAAKLGKLLGVSAVVLGSVTEFNTRTDKKGVLGVGTKVQTASVAINARVVDTSSAEIIFAVESKGQEEATNVTVGSYYGSNSTGAKDALLTAATKKASVSIIQSLKENSSKMNEPTLEGLIVNIDPTDKSIMIDLGTESGLTNGQQMYVLKVVKEIKNQSGEVIKRITNVVGELSVKDAEKKVSTCTCINGTCDNIKEGDRVASIK